MATNKRIKEPLPVTHPDLVKKLFEQEVAEIQYGTVEIKSIAREAGSRTKIAVSSNNPNVDAVGACVGVNGSRVNLIVDELNGEKIDIVNWDWVLFFFIIIREIITIVIIYIFIHSLIAINIPR